VAHESRGGLWLVAKQCQQWQWRTREQRRAEPWLHERQLGFLLWSRQCGENVGRAKPGRGRKPMGGSGWLQCPGACAMLEKLADLWPLAWPWAGSSQGGLSPDLVSWAAL
jgi:hypothetical protein